MLPVGILKSDCSVVKNRQEINNCSKEHYTVVSKGTKKKKEKLEKEYPDDYALINKVLDIKKRHKNKIGSSLR